MQELVKIHNGKPVASSLEIAAYFNKRHDNVIRDIRSLIDQDPEYLLLKSESIYYEDSYSPRNGQDIPQKSRPTV